MKVYFFVADMSLDDYNFLLEKFKLIKRSTDTKNIIQDNFCKIWDKNRNWKTINTTFLEVMVFVNYYLSKLWWNIEDVHLVWRENFFLFNEEIFIYKNNDFEKIEEETLFATSRDLWSHLFFWFLSDLSLKDNKIKIFKPNFKRDWHYNDKLYFINKLYPNRKNLIWDIIIPFFMNPTEELIQIFFDKVDILLWDKIIIKKSFGDMGKTVRALDLWDWLDVSDIKQKFFNNTHYSFHGLYITPWYNIKNEYRVYFLYDKDINKIKIYSVKSRVNNIDKTIFQKENLEIYKNLDTTWNYLNPKEFIKRDKSYQFVKKIIKNIWYETGVLEIMETKENDLKFIEINYMWGSLMFDNEDKQLLQDFYMDMYDMISYNGNNKKI